MGKLVVFGYLCFIGTCISASATGKPSDSTGLDQQHSRSLLFSALLAGDYKLAPNEIEAGMNTQAAFEAEIATLKDRISILDKVSFQQGQSFKIPSAEESYMPPAMCKSELGHSSNASLANLNKVVDSIKRTLQFVASHVDQLNTIEPAFALAVLKAVDDKEGGELQKVYPLTELISKICASLPDSREADSCTAVTSLWKARQGSLKPESVIQEYSSEFNSVGSEPEVLWGKLNGECQVALLTRCEVPYVCERTLFDPTPRSQYMLTHQLLQRLLAEFGSCSAAKDLVDQEVNHRMCAKMYKEAQLISALKTPEIYRDLFAEQIGLCGSLGYSNFLRQDWLDLILSFQSKSDYGCFVRDKNVEQKFMTTDTPIKRSSTDVEKQAGLESDEECLPHFTSVSLMALTSYLDYFGEKCQ